LYVPCGNVIIVLKVTSSQISRSFQDVEDSVDDTISLIIVGCFEVKLVKDDIGQ
jgi:hypothetical protein